MVAIWIAINGCIFLALALGAVFGEAKADTWTGAGQAVANQTRDWRIPANWQLGIVPPATDSNTFSYFGEGTIELNGPQTACEMNFNDFTYTTIAPGVLLPPSSLTMVNPPAAASAFWMGEGVRDTYGSDYFTAGPQITADVNLNNNPINTPIGVILGSPIGPGSNSSMMFSGQINNLNNNALFYGGLGAGTSLWISANNNFNGGINNFITIASAPVGGANGYTLHLVDSGRMNFTPIALQGTSSYLGLQDNTGGGAGGVQLPGNVYNNWVWSYGGNVFTDRSYQLPGQDSNTTVNVLEYLMGGVRDYNGMINFGSTGSFGRTNNGFSLRLGTFDWEHNAPMELVHVNNGNLTEGRGGSRYVSGANRLQEAHNYVYVDMLNEMSEHQVNVIPLGKGGTGVLAIDRLNGGLQGALQQWISPPQVLAGVLRLGSANNPHNAPSVQLLAPDAAVGFGWDTQIFAPVAVPFPILPAGVNPGQCGAVDIDLWNFGWTVLAIPTINTNFQVGANQWSYLRVGSSMGGDATFDPQPNPAKHASVAFLNQLGMQTQIIPNVNPPGISEYYFGGGGGTLRLDCQLQDYGQQTWLEMGTTGNLLPGRIALNPGGDINQQEPNLYTGPTRIFAGTLQLMKQNSVWASQLVSCNNYDMNITNGLYAVPGAPGATWVGPGQLLLDPARNGVAKNWSLNWYTVNGGVPLINALFLDSGVIGWTGDVNLTAVPGIYGKPLISNLNPLVNPNVILLGLGGEYSAGTMFAQFKI
ncbi:MAG: hypothetical protein ABSA77_09735, partial [Thermoguttaceae bacterium]